MYVCMYDFNPFNPVLKWSHLSLNLDESISWKEALDKIKNEIPTNVDLDETQVTRWLVKEEYSGIIILI